MRDGKVHGQMASPGMTDHPRPIPAEGIQDRHCIGDVPFNGAVAFHHGRCQATLLVARHGQDWGQLGSQVIEVVGEARATVQEQCGRAIAASPANDLAAQDCGAELLLAHAEPRAARIWFA